MAALALERARGYLALTKPGIVLFVIFTGLPALLMAAGSTEEVSPVNHLSQDDVPVLLAYATALDTPITAPGIGIHHPRFGDFLKKKMDPLGIECRVETRVRRGSEEWVQQTMEFLKKNW